jgi:hypothetical protein
MPTINCQIMHPRSADFVFGAAPETGGDDGHLFLL